MALPFVKVTANKRTRLIDVYVESGNGRIVRQYHGGCWVVTVRATTPMQARALVYKGVVAETDRVLGIQWFSRGDDLECESRSAWPWPGGAGVR